MTGDFAAATVIILNTTDNDGNTYTFERITVGDVIRLGAADGSGAEYRITTLLGGGSFGVEHLRSTPQAAENLTVHVLSSFDPQGTTIPYVDAQDNLKLNQQAARCRAGRGNRAGSGRQRNRQDIR